MFISLISLVLPRTLLSREICKQLPDSALLTRKSLHLLFWGSTSSVPSQAPLPQGLLEVGVLPALPWALSAGSTLTQASPSATLQALSTTTVPGCPTGLQTPPWGWTPPSPFWNLLPSLPPHAPLPPLDPNPTHLWVPQPMLLQFCLLPSTLVGGSVVTMAIVRQYKSNPIISLTEKASNATRESLSLGQGRA